jgi:hypothetical protein
MEETPNYSGWMSCAARCFERKVIEHARLQKKFRIDKKVYCIQYTCFVERTLSCDIRNSKLGKSAEATEAYINFYVVSTSNDRIQFRK